VNEKKVFITSMKAHVDRCLKPFSLFHTPILLTTKILVYINIKPFGKQTTNKSLQKEENL